MEAFTQWVVSAISVYGVPMLFVLCYIGSLGIPFPITPVIIAAGSLSRMGFLDQLLMIIACLGGASLADQSIFFIGRAAFPALKKRYGATRIWRQAVSISDRQGQWAILLTRFWLTSLAPVVNILSAGRFGYFRFLMLDLIGESLWVILYGGLGYLFAAQWQNLSRWTSVISGFSLLITFLAIILLQFLFKQKKAAVHRKEELYLYKN